MINIINKEKIEVMINQFYNFTGLEENHNPLMVNKLSVITDGCISVGFQETFDYFEDEDSAYDHEMGLVLDCYIRDTFYIRPAWVFTSDNPNLGITLEWLPNKPVYVTSKSDYTKLYKSFVEYLETENAHTGGFSFENLEFSICYSNLYQNTSTVKLASIHNPRLNVLFTDDDFKPDTTEICTLNVICEYNF